MQRKDGKVILVDVETGKHIPFFPVDAREILRGQRGREVRYVRLEDVNAVVQRDAERVTAEAIATAARAAKAAVVEEDDDGGEFDELEEAIAPRGRRR